MKLLKYLLGPELIWLVAIFAATGFKRVAHMNPAKYDKLIEGSTLWPLVVLALTICLYLVPGVPKPWLFLRITVAAIIGTHFVMNPVLEAHSKGGPGVGTIYIVAYLAMVVAIPIGFAIKAIFFKS